MPRIPEVVTKTAEALTGIRYVNEGGRELMYEEVAAVPGTTFKVEELFFNTPARRKFLKKLGAEAAAVTDFMQKIAMGHPEVSFQYIRGTSRVLHTPGIIACAAVFTRYTAKRCWAI